MSTNFRDLQPLLRPRSIAVIGASQRANRGRRVIENLQRFGFEGQMYAVNPKYDDILGVPTVDSIAALPDGVDLIVLALGADAALVAAAEAGERGIGSAVLIGSGFGEGNVGVDRADELRAILAKYDMVACGPNCYGVFDVYSGTAAYAGRIIDPTERGNVALVMQSGALTHAVTDSAMGRGLGLSALVTAGNELSVTVSDYVAWYAQDDNTTTIGVFVEGLRDADKFAAACRLARANGKSVIVLASGRSEIGREAAMAHTGAIAGGPAALDGYLASIGAIRVDDLDELRETLLLFSAMPPASGQPEGLAALSISGGASGLMADMAETVGMTLPRFNAGIVTELDSILPEFAGHNNPLDVTGAAAEDPTILSRSFEVVATEQSVGAIVFAINVGLTDPVQVDFYRSQVETVAAASANSAKPLVLLAITSGALDPSIAAVADAANMPVLMGLRPGMRALKSWLAAGSLTPSTAGAATTSTPWPFADAVVPGADAMRLLADGGVPMAPFGSATDVAGVRAVVEQIGVPVVLKIESPDIAHKSDVGGVKLKLGTADEAVAAAEEMLRVVGASEPDAMLTGFLAQQMVMGESLEVLVGVVRDPQVGLIVSVAPGGVLAELVGAAPSRPVPASREDIESLLDQSVLAKLLPGYRGSAVYDREALIDAVIAVADLAATLPDLAALEINPLLVRPEGEGVVAVDALFIRN